ncbi:MAG TPA: glycoside hydrolase family 5 protein [Verrucomicrobiae bacterium]|nr:glycoside hydrolase family 5 protein [Verrucomicrobiae bacterium]
MRTFTISIAIFVCANVFAADKQFVPPAKPQMQPISSHDTPAYRAAKMFRHGVNLGNYLEAPPSQSWGVTVSADEFAKMRAEGFDHVRVPIGWQQYAGKGPDFILSPEIFSRVDFVVTNALKNRLAVIINIHHFNGLDENPINATPKFLALWKQIAAHYKKFPMQLAFELDNEPHDNATAAAMNPIYAKSILEIRKSNPRRTIFVEPATWGSIDQLTNLTLPADDNVIVSVHCYDPFYFTHQGATWAGDDTKVVGIQFPGPPAKPLVPDASLKLNPWVTNWIARYNSLPTAQNPSGPIAFENEIKFAKAWSDFYGRPIHFGEFGAYTKADEQSRANFYGAFRHALEKEKIGWAIWDWSAGFCYWDKKKNQPMPGMHDALFGKPSAIKTISRN